MTRAELGLHFIRGFVTSLIDDNPENKDKLKDLQGHVSNYIELITPLECGHEGPKMDGKCQKCFLK